MKSRIEHLMDRKRIVLSRRRDIQIGHYQESTLTRRVGVVIGCYKWPSVARLQCRLIRRTCGPVAILLSEDCTPGKAAEFSAIHHEEQVALWSNRCRIGHGGGDLAGFWKAPQWAAAMGLDYVAKLSQRFLVTRGNWLQDSAQELAGSGKALATQRARGAEHFDLRTEAVMIDVQKWNNPHVLASLAPRHFEKGESNEAWINAVVRERFGGEFHPWSLFGEDRSVQQDGVFFRLSANVEEYRAIAAEVGVELEGGFHAEGWQADHAVGEYLH